MRSKLDSRSTWLKLAACAGLLAALTPAQAEDAAKEQANVCAPVAIPGHYGPFDYVSEHARLEIVERFHFTPKVEALIGGESDYLGGDLTYTLYSSPNHHRALLAIMRFGERTKNVQPPHLALQIDCFFDRAVRFRPRDIVVRSLYALYLAQQLNKPQEALAQLEVASDFAGDDGMSHYNIGLTYLSLKAYDKALAEAHMALNLGYGGTRLEAELRKANQWKDPAN